MAPRSRRCTAVDLSFNQLFAKKSVRWQYTLTQLTHCMAPTLLPGLSSAKCCEILRMAIRLGSIAKPRVGALPYAPAKPFASFKASINLQVGSREGVHKHCTCRHFLSCCLLILMIHLFHLRQFHYASDMIPPAPIRRPWSHHSALFHYWRGASTPNLELNKQKRMHSCHLTTVALSASSRREYCWLSLGFACPLNVTGHTSGALLPHRCPVSPLIPSNTLDVPRVMSLSRYVPTTRHIRVPWPRILRPMPRGRALSHSRKKMTPLAAKRQRSHGDYGN